MLKPVSKRIVGSFFAWCGQVTARWLVVSGIALSTLSCSTTASVPPPLYDVIVRNGTVYDGTGAPGVTTDIAISGDRIAAIGDLSYASSVKTIDAHGRAVAPGFINMLSWAIVSLIQDGRGLSDVQQGVTLEVFGEGWSMGPLSTESEAEVRKLFSEGVEFERQWTSLGEYLEWLARRGVSPNIASFVGATTVRINQLVFADRPPSADELQRMRTEVAVAMEEGAMGLGSSLIYPPAFYADTAELIALAEVVGRYNGLYTSHLRSEGARLLESVEELITIAEQANVNANIYHLKAVGKNNWHKLAAVFSRVEAARARGLNITADIYPYTAGATGILAMTPPWAQEGGLEAFIERARDPRTRARILADMRTPTDAWEQLLIGSGGGEGVLFFGFSRPSLQPLIGTTLAEVAAQRRTSVEETVLDLIVENRGRAEAAFFLMAEDNMPKKLLRPWVAISSDAEAEAPEGEFLDRNTHPRAYGAFARVLRKYVREQQVLTLAEAIRRMTSLPADILNITDRGVLHPGAFADIVIFDPDTVQDHATYLEPLQLATGVADVFINGEQVLAEGKHTGALPGRVVRGPGYVGASETIALTTKRGVVELKLYPDQAPQLVRNFLSHVDRARVTRGALSVANDREDLIVMKLQAPRHRMAEYSVSLAAGGLFSIFSGSQGEGQPLGRVAAGMEILQQLLASPTAQPVLRIDHAARVSRSFNATVTGGDT